MSVCSTQPSCTFEPAPMRISSLSPRRTEPHQTLAPGSSTTRPISTAFGAIQAAGDVDPALVAGGIKVALLTTAAGLIIAIPVNIAYNFFVSRIDRLIVDMEQGAQRILNLAWDLEKQGRLRILEAKPQEFMQP